MFQNTGNVFHSGMSFDLAILVNDKVSHNEGCSW
jgi:hypothetical protein